MRGRGRGRGKGIGVGGVDRMGSCIGHLNSSQ